MPGRSSPGHADSARRLVSIRRACSRCEPLSITRHPEQTTPKYPFVLTTGRTLYEFNAGTMTGRGHTRKLRPADLLEISCTDAEMADVRDGDLVRLVSRYGSATLADSGQRGGAARRVVRDLPHGKGIPEQRHWQSGRQDGRHTGIQGYGGQTREGVISRLILDHSKRLSLTSRANSIGCPGVRSHRGPRQALFGVSIVIDAEKCCVCWSSAASMTLGAVVTCHADYDEGSAQSAGVIGLAKLSSTSAITRRASMPAGRRAAARSSRD